jgi:hypothetical protein
VYPWYATQEGGAYREKCDRVHEVMRTIWRNEHASQVSYLEWYYSDQGKKVRETLSMNRSSEVKYLDEEERRAYEVHFEKEGEGYQLISSHSGVPLCGKTWMCVMAPDGTLYAGAKQPGRFHHSSFLAGSDVLSAFEVRTDSKGMVTKFENFSGHYRPSPESIQRMFDQLRKKGIDLPANIPVKWEFDVSSVTGAGLV